MNLLYANAIVTISRGEERGEDKELQFYLLSNCNYIFKNASLDMKLPSALFKSRKQQGAAIPFLRRRIG